MLRWMYRWLPIIFGCHCRSDRSFFLKGRQFPLCARCTGELFGILFSPVLFFAFGVCRWYIAVILMLPMITDGLLQLVTKYESKNMRRAITGFLFGIGLIALLILSTRATLRFGYQFGQRIKPTFF